MKGFIHRIGGFTLIELMISVTILLLMAGFSVARLVDFADRRAVFNDAKFVVEELRKIRTKATAIEVPSGCSGVSSYNVSLSGSDIDVDVACTLGSVDNYIQSSLSGSVFLISYTVIFDTYGRTGVDTDILVCKNGDGYKIVVTSEGVINQPVEVVAGMCSYSK
jgi:prepilin-type N-terminal cleavage/methylation domain-containing protein